jgi:DNA-binding NarL/FixJ family response regulator
MMLHDCFFGVQRDLGRIRGYATEILLALEHLHAKGLVHCDLTPQNVLREKGYNREKARLKLSNLGASCNFAYKEIADVMNISFETVRTYVRSIYDKLHVHSRAEATIKYHGR